MGFLCHKQKTVKYISPFFIFITNFLYFFHIHMKSLLHSKKRKRKYHKSIIYRFQLFSKTSYDIDRQKFSRVFCPSRSCKIIGYRV